MKIRNGFVSNSSSSSFIITGISMPDFRILEKTQEEIVAFYESIGVTLLASDINSVDLSISTGDLEWLPLVEDCGFIYTHSGVMFGSWVCPFGITPDEAMNGIIPQHEIDVVKKAASATGKKIECIFYESEG